MQGGSEARLYKFGLYGAFGAFARLLGYTEQELIGLNLDDLYDRLPNVGRNYVSLVLNARRHITHEVQHKHKDGSWLDVETGANVVTHEGKEVLSIVVRDITERKIAQERIHYLRRVEQCGVGLAVHADIQFSSCTVVRARPRLTSAGRAKISTSAYLFSTPTLPDHDNHPL